MRLVRRAGASARTRPPARRGTPRHEDEEPVAGLDHRAAARRDRSVSAGDGGDEGGPRQPELPHRGAGDRVRRRDAEVDEVERARDALTSSGAGAREGPAPRRLRRSATHSSVVPWTSAETTTTKKTALKIVLAALDPGGEDDRPEHDRDRAAEPGPAEQRPFAGGEVVEGRRDPDGGRADEEDEQRRQGEPGRATAGRSWGKTSSPSTTNIATWARNASPSWKATSWRRCRDGVLPTASPTR